MKYIKLFEEFMNESIEIDSINPTGSVFVNYTPEKRAKATKFGKNITSLDRTMGGSPDDLITVYRGSLKSQNKIVPGDFVTTNKQLAKDYAGTGHVIELKVRKGDILDDKSEPLGEEYLYIPNFDKMQS
jgi:hypothetical protein